ncbi:hypothetical protein ONE63_007028 [Megalurothrips usitatus]|uniref:Ketosynthase family 3 (KS3) domain-containing protein n=1 Tax=Megalurothrips usitatus TaxID=439358 RepID=A0AAV7XRS4_9NEOP|nr:hypothetical protein ONE63_007028 [Megalurothrips usitatus]
MSDREVEVVISGVGGWFPGCCRSLPELAEQLLANKYLVQQQETRWKKSGDLREQPLFGTIGDCGDFDHAFFGMHQKLAYWTDPAARLCIERSFEAIIDAGLSPRELRGSKTNVYASYTFSDFEALMLDHFEAPSGYAIAGMSRTMVPNRISYFYDLKGQSCGFDGNWPWGELGLQMAQDAIRAGSCDAALVLASSVVQQPERTAQCRVMGLVSEDGLCRSFDAAASGGQRSDAVVCFVVQRADRAKRCYARVVASRCGVAGPVGAAGDPMSHNPRGVERLLRGFYRDCGEDPSKVAYLEADGSGCRLWEEAELHASGEVLAGRGQRAGKLLVGSVKSNVGHTDGCAGMLAVAKLIVAMETGVIPATINHATPNTNITALRDGRLQIVTSNTALPVDGDTLLAATTLGLGGAVGHVLVKPNPKAKAPRAARSPELPRVVTVSGRTEDGVLGALRRVQAQPFDPEYLRLVQDAFTDIKGHTVRGFTLVPPSRDQPIYKINVAARLPASLDVACHNSATSCTLAGPADDVRAFVDVLQAEGTFARAVNASDIAFHSRYVRPAAPLVMQGLRSVIPEPRPRSPRWLSTSVPEERWGEAEARYCSPEYQTNNLLRPVLFEEVLAHVPDDAVLLEVAPHGLLQPILKRALPQCHHLSLTQRGAADGLHFLLEAIGGLYCLGQDPVVSALCPDVEFPVSRGTPSLAPLVSWDHAERNTFLDRPAQDCRTVSGSAAAARAGAGAGAGAGDEREADTVSRSRP